MKKEKKDKRRKKDLRDKLLVCRKKMVIQKRIIGIILDASGENLICSELAFAYKQYVPRQQYDIFIRENVDCAWPCHKTQAGLSMRMRQIPPVPRGKDMQPVFIRSD